jgi:hypothetical protein
MLLSINCRTLVLQGQRRISNGSPYQHGHSYSHFKISILRTLTIKRWINRPDTEMHFHYSIFWKHLEWRVYPNLESDSESQRTRIFVFDTCLLSLHLTVRIEQGNTSWWFAHLNHSFMINQDFTILPHRRLWSPSGSSKNPTLDFRPETSWKSMPALNQCLCKLLRVCIHSISEIRVSTISTL